MIPFYAALNFLVLQPSPMLPFLIPALLDRQVAGSDGVLGQSKEGWSAPLFCLLHLSDRVIAGWTCRAVNP